MSIHDRIRRLEHRVKVLEETTVRKSRQREEPGNRARRCEKWLVGYLSGKKARKEEDTSTYNILELPAKSEMAGKVFADAYKAGFPSVYLKRIRLDRLAKRINILQPKGTQRWMWRLVE